MENVLKFVFSFCPVVVSFFLAAIHLVNLPGVQQGRYHTLGNSTSVAQGVHYAFRTGVGHLPQVPVRLRPRRGPEGL